MSLLNPVLESLENDYAYNNTILLCLIPTQFCVTPSVVTMQPVDISLEYSLIACGSENDIQFRCIFDSSFISVATFVSLSALYIDGFQRKIDFNAQSPIL